MVEVPLAVVTLTATVPLPAGLVAVICVSLSTVNCAPAEPNETPLAPVKPVPVIVTVVPPAAGPLFGLTLVTVGRGGADDVGGCCPCPGCCCTGAGVTVTFTIACAVPELVLIVNVTVALWVLESLTFVLILKSREPFASNWLPPPLTDSQFPPSSVATETESVPALPQLVTVTVSLPGLWNVGCRLLA